MTLRMNPPAGAALAVVLLIAAASTAQPPGFSRTENPMTSQREEQVQEQNQAELREAAEAARAARNAQTGEGEQPAAAPAGGGEAAERSAPRGRQGDQAAPGTGGSQMGEFNLRLDRDVIMLRLTGKNDPRMTDIDVTEGGEFVTDLQLINPRSRPIDRVRLIMDYNPAFVEPVSINDTPISGRLAGTPAAVVDRRLGQIRYEAELSEPVTELDSPLLFVTWKALKPVLGTTIRFGRDEAENFSELFYEGEPVLGAPYDPGDGTVSLSLQVIPSDPAEALLMQEEPQLYVGSDERVGGVLLRLRPPRERIVVGEPFAIDVVLDNTAYSQLDGVSMLLEYDPEVLDILDVDQDNWITLQTNILDGPYREDFPFDYHMANAVYTGRGTIEYRVGTSFPDEFLGASGVMAQIWAVAKKPSAGTSVRFMFAPRPGLRTTEVTYLGQDVLGSTKIKNDGVRGAYFRIHPEGRGPVAAGE